MGYSLENFEDWVPKDILRKGEDYWQKDNVDNLAQDGDVWEADVYGSKDYLVEVKVEKGEVKEWFCDCPYDYGPICKHVAAVLFEIREEVPEEELALAKKAEMRPISRGSQKESSAQNPIEEIIGKLDAAEMKRLITYLADRHEEVRSHLLTRYAKLLTVVSKEQYQKLVESILDAHSGGRRGYLEYDDADRLGDRIYALIQEADRENAIGLVYLCEEIIRQLARAFEYADDSSGSMGMAMEEAFQNLHHLANKDNDTPKDVLEYIFEYALLESSKAIYQGWDWAGNLRVVATEAVRTKAQAEQLMEMLEYSIRENKKVEYRDYEIEQAARLKHLLLENYYSATKAVDFLEANLAYSSFRTMALEKAMEEKRYEDVRRLARQGVVQDTQRKYPGLVNKWKKWLIRLAEETGDQNALAQLNEELFLQGGDMEYYRELKKLLSKADFAEKIEQFIRYYREKDYPYRQSQFNQNVANILQEENRLEDLMAEIRKSPALHLLDQYYSVLAKKNATEYLNLYERAIRKYMELHTGRNYYRECCRYIDKIIRLGDIDRAKKIVRDWRATYPRRRAMIEELAKYQWRSD